MSTWLNKTFIVIWLSLTLSAFGHADPLSQDLDEIQGFYRSLNQLYTAGQPEAGAFKTLADAGVRHVINLRPAAEMPEMNEAAIVTQNQMAYYNIPIANASELSRDKVVLLDNLLQKIGDEKVLIHCSSSNRVGAMLALRAAWILELSKEQALEIGKRHGMTKLQPAVERLLLE